MTIMENKHNISWLSYWSWPFSNISWLSYWSGHWVGVPNTFHANGQTRDLHFIVT